MTISRSVAAIAVLFVTATAAEAGKYQWSAIDPEEGSGIRQHWAAYPDPNDEQDHVLDISCTSRGARITIGAEFGIGKGKKEPVEITLKEGSDELKVVGRSQDSDNAEMTGGKELATEFGAGDKIVEFLRRHGTFGIYVGKKLKGTVILPGTGPVLDKFFAVCAK